jgi:hypothetical protein
MEGSPVPLHPTARQRGLGRGLGLGQAARRDGVRSGGPPPLGCISLDKACMPDTERSASAARAIDRCPADSIKRIGSVQRSLVRPISRFGRCW